MAKELSELLAQNIIDSRDIIERFEELTDERESLESDISEAQETVDELREESNTVDEHDSEACADMEKRLSEAEDELENAKKELTDWDEENKEELDQLTEINDECSGYGDWEHGETLISENHFTEYCEELVKDIGDLPSDIPSYIEIDWEATADNLKADYTSVEIDGKAWYYRA